MNAAIEFSVVHNDKIVYIVFLQEKERKRQEALIAKEQVTVF